MTSVLGAAPFFTTTTRFVSEGVDEKEVLDEDEEDEDEEDDDEEDDDEEDDDEEDDEVDEESDRYGCFTGK